MKEKDINEKEQNGREVVMYDYKAVSKLLGVNSNKALEFLKKFGVKIGHWQIEKESLLEILRKNRGEV